MNNAFRALDIGLHLHSQTNPRVHEQQGPILISRGHGARVFDETGKEFIEGMAGLWCASLGFANERLAKVAFDQMKRLSFYYTANHRSNEAVTSLLDEIAKVSNIHPCRIYLAGGGSEANDSMVKFVWYYNTARGKPNKRKIISRHGAYHGSTVMAAILSGLPHMHNAFNLPTQDMLYASRPHYSREARDGESPEEFGARLAAELEELILMTGPENIAAMIAEPVMGAGGVVIPPDNYFPLVQEILHRHDILLLSDEIICGFGRTGNWFGAQTFNFQPDMMSIAKGLSAGHLPIGAVVMSDKIYQVIADQAAKLGVFGHGFTYSGHPVTAAVAAEAIRIYHEIDIIARARNLGTCLLGGLKKKFSGHEMVGEIRGVGLMAGIELVACKKTGKAFKPEQRIGAMVEQSCRRHGAVVRNMGDTIAFCPPFIIEEQEIDMLIERVGKAIDETADAVTQPDFAGVEG
jgi:4-aminobutyrate--pyruvate transaminase